MGGNRSAACPRIQARRSQPHRSPDRAAKIRIHVVWDDDALSDLESIGAFIESDSPAAARRVVERIQRTSILLETSPRLGRPALGRPGVREITVSRYPYVLVYELSKNEVRILSVFHQAQDRS